MKNRGVVNCTLNIRETGQRVQTSINHLMQKRMSIDQQSSSSYFGDLLFPK